MKKHDDNYTIIVGRVYKIDNKYIVQPGENVIIDGNNTIHIYTLSRTTLSASDIDDVSMTSDEFAAADTNRDGMIYIDEVFLNDTSMLVDSDNNVIYTAEDV